LEVATAAEVFLAVKTLKSACCDKIRPEMLKAFNRQILWLICVCQVAWCSGRARLSNWGDNRQTQERKQEVMHLLMGCLSP